MTFEFNNLFLVGCRGSIIALSSKNEAFSIERRSVVFERR
jgi:hypothetical protein